MTEESKIIIDLLPEKTAVCRLEHGSDVPEWAFSGEFFSVTGTPDELSVVCPQDCVPGNIMAEKEWRVFKVRGPLDFSLVGIIRTVSKVLADSGVSLFAVSTYDTDYFLVKEDKLADAVTALKAVCTVNKLI